MHSCVVHSTIKTKVPEGFACLKTPKKIQRSDKQLLFLKDGSWAKGTEDKPNSTLRIYAKSNCWGWWQAQGMADPDTNEVWNTKDELVREIWAGFFFVRRALRLALHELQVWQHLLFFWKRTSPCCPFSPGMFSPHANLVHTEKVWLYFHDFEFLYWVALQGTIRFVKHAKKQKNKEPRTTLFVAVETHALAWQKSKSVCLLARQTLQANAIPMEAEEGKITCGCFSATYYLLL